LIELKRYLKQVCLKKPLERVHMWSQFYVDGLCVPYSCIRNTVICVIIWSA